MWNAFRINALVNGRCGSNIKSVNLECTLQIKFMRTSCEIDLGWMPQNIDDMSTLVRLMALCFEATGHYLGQCWLKSMLSYGITSSLWVVAIMPMDTTPGLIWSAVINPRLSTMHPVLVLLKSPKCSWWMVSTNFTSTKPIYNQEHKHL